MTSLGLFLIYLSIGVVFLWDRNHEIAAEAALGDFNSLALAIFRRAMTWPWWAFKR